MGDGKLQVGLSEKTLWEMRLTRRRLLRNTGVGAASLFGGAALLAACSSSDDSAGGGDTGSGEAATLNVGFAYIGPVTDNGWTFTHDEGRKAVEAALGSNVKTTYVENVPISAEAGQTFEQLAADNQLVIANTEYANFLSDVAAKHPDVAFLEADGHTYTDNLFAYYVEHVAPNYLLGVAAGMLAPSGKIGYIGAFPSFRIDHILCGPELRSWAFQTLPDELSDHRPITCWMGMRPPLTP